jgi:hypothetical protein
VCGNKRLRAVMTEDYCYFASLELEKYDPFESALKENGIEALGVPFVMGGTSYASGGRPNARKVYIRYKNIEKAAEIYRDLFGEDVKEEPKEEW